MQIMEDERDFDRVLAASPDGVRIDRISRSPEGPFDAIFADGLVVYRRPQETGRGFMSRMDYREGDPSDLRRLADSVARRAMTPAIWLQRRDFGGHVYITVSCQRGDGEWIEVIRELFSAHGATNPGEISHIVEGDTVARLLSR